MEKNHGIKSLFNARETFYYFAKKKPFINRNKKKQFFETSTQKWKKKINSHSTVVFGANL